ncbi:MAG: Hsp20 family protein [Bacilli bacterium]
MNLLPKRFYLDDMFDNFLTKDESNMKCDIYEKNGLYHIEMDIPGFDKNDINIECKNGYLKINASKKTEKKEEDKNYIRKERICGSYSREFYVGKIDEEKIDASFKDGILNIIVPKEEEQNNKRIEIK